MSNFDDVGEFHKKFDLPDARRIAPKIIPHRMALFRITFLQEELMELTKAVMNDELPDIADALVDLVYVALGTAHYYGIPWEQCWDAVQRANMEKERATLIEDSKRGSILDVVKPEGWQPPDLATIIKRYQ